MTDLSNVTWRKSSRSSGNGACVEMAAVANMCAVRDSKNPDGPVLILDIRPFIEAIRSDRFER